MHYCCIILYLFIASENYKTPTMIVWVSLSIHRVGWIDIKIIIDKKYVEKKYSFGLIMFVMIENL